MSNSQKNERSYKRIDRQDLIACYKCCFFQFTLIFVTFLRINKKQELEL